jgi:hypothetical protein
MTIFCFRIFFFVFNDTTAKEIIREVFNFLTISQSTFFDLNIYLF